MSRHAIDAASMLGRIRLAKEGKKRRREEGKMGRREEGKKANSSSLSFTAALLESIVYDARVALLWH